MLIVTKRETILRNFFLDLTVHSDGSVCATIGPLQDKQQAERWERWLLINADSIALIWLQPMNAKEEAAWKMHVATMEAETQCLPQYHEHWMKANPLPVTA